RRAGLSPVNTGAACCARFTTHPSDLWSAFLLPTPQGGKETNRALAIPHIHVGAELAPPAISYTPGCSALHSFILGWGKGLGGEGLSPTPHSLFPTPFFNKKAPRTFAERPACAFS